MTSEYNIFEADIEAWLSRPVDQGERNVLSQLYYFAMGVKLLKELESEGVVVQVLNYSTGKYGLVDLGRKRLKNG